MLTYPVHVTLLERTMTVPTVTTSERISSVPDYIFFDYWVVCGD